jgi:hypothetical protein
MMILVAVASAALLPAGGEAGVAGFPATRSTPCKIVQPLQHLPNVLAESSGVARSGDPGLFWSHGDTRASELFAVDAEAKLAGRVRVDGARSGDWEDIAKGPCPAGTCLYIADIGDNQAARRSVAVHRLPEPGPRDTASKPAETFEARYPEGPNDAEALFVLSADEVYAVTKGDTGPIAVYRFPLSGRSGSPAAMQKVRELASGKVKHAKAVTGASATPDGRWVALRSPTAVAFFRAKELLADGAPAFAMDLGELREPQGEGVSLGEDGSVILTGEGRKGRGTVARLSCQLP